MSPQMRAAATGTRETGMANSHGRFVWYELATTDMEAAKAFYAYVVGWGTERSRYRLHPVYRWRGLCKRADGPAGRREKIGLEAELARICRRRRRRRRRRAQQLGGALHVPPKDVLNISRISVAVDPQRATIGLFKWLSPGQEQPAELDARGRVGWHELLATDWEKAFAFYRNLFGWQQVDADTSAMGAYQLFSAGEQTVGGMFTKPPTVPVPFWLYYFNIGDIDLAMKRVKARSGQILNGPIEVPGNRWIIRCTDPQGAILALMGKRSHNGIGYFERLPRNPSSARFGARR
jgi:predicted enzyme related to lactoylglutathione lyase